MFCLHEILSFSEVKSSECHRAAVRSIEILPGVMITNDRCVILEEGPTAILGDLHLGYETALEDEGIYLPHINTESIKMSLNDIISRYEPERMVLLGDIKHDFRKVGYKGKEEVRRVISMLTEACDLTVIRGNHDNYLQNILADMGVMVADYADMMGFRLEHGHIDSGKRPVIIGHEHPSIRIPGAVGGSVKLHCFVHARKDGVLVLPPFSPFSSGNDLSLDKSCVMASALKESDLENAEIYGISDMGLMDLGTLRGIMDIRL